ncbi:MAG: hypothetical protein U5L45_06180 [Saprospiraceae bacterium]|nr:hypothetical protein [Saprospiraceae bacterium]
MKQNAQNQRYTARCKSKAVYICARISYALASLARRSECGSFFGQSPKNEPLF